jgi:hypothetical protein
VCIPLAGHNKTSRVEPQAMEARVDTAQMMALGLDAAHVIRYKEHETTRRPRDPRACVASPRGRSSGLPSLGESFLRKPPLVAPLLSL